MEPRCPQEVRPAHARPLEPLSRSPGASLPPPSVHTLTVSSRTELVAWEGAVAGSTDSRVRRPACCGPGARLGVGPRGVEGTLSRRAARAAAGRWSLRHLAGAAPGLPFSVVPAGLRACPPPLEVGAWS